LRIGWKITGAGSSKGRKRSTVTTPDQYFWMKYNAGVIKFNHMVNEVGMERDNCQ
jgi:hypothetical protein